MPAKTKRINPLDTHPNMEVFSAKVLRAAYSIPKKTFVAAVDAGLVKDTDHRREDVTDELLFTYRLIFGSEGLTAQEVSKLVGVDIATVLSTTKHMKLKPSKPGAINSAEWSGDSLVTLIGALMLGTGRSVLKTTVAEACADRVRATQRTATARVESRRLTIERARVRRDRRQQQRDVDLVRIAELRESITATLREASDRSEHRVILNLGPTNSGKTYHAVQRLIAGFKNNPNGCYVYAGPLRMLAHEVYDSIADIVGVDNVGVLTGEETINPEAPIMCCTAEMAPRQGDVLVVDEAHWAADDSRGKHWTELLMFSDFRDTVVLGPSECENLLVSVFPDLPENSIVVTHHARKTPLEYIGQLTVKDIGPRTAVVAFSRRKVTEIVDSLRRNGITALPMYGALPLKVRKDHVSKFISGDVDVIVTTDVIGHGVNLPIDNIVFTDTVKFDGTRRRSLQLWEAAQIAGRAGRFGLSDQGTVGFWRFSGKGTRGHSDISEDLLRQAVLAVSGEHPSELESLRLRVTPRLSALGLRHEDHHLLYVAMQIWSEKAKVFHRHSTLVSPSKMYDARRNLQSVATVLKTSLISMNGESLGEGDRSKKFYGEWSSIHEVRDKKPWTIPLDDLWELIHGPFDPDDLALHAGARWFSFRDPSTVVAAWNKAINYTSRWTWKETLEKRAHQVSAFRSLGVMLDSNGPGNLPGGISVNDMIREESKIIRELSAIFEDELSDVKRNSKTPQLVG
ncbi:MAG: hypothetical protein E6R04_03595 [Spirochaetes bacterium]|nr:MAG: hypothetical protein E6R04_03595 [Spirochaetota bacterium]